MATLRELYERGAVRVGYLITYPSGNVYRLHRTPGSIPCDFFLLEVVKHYQYRTGEVVGVDAVSHNVTVQRGSPIPMAHVR